MSISGKTLEILRNDHKNDYLKSNSKASNNKIKFEKLQDILSQFGELKVYDYDHNF